MKGFNYNVSTLFGNVGNNNQFGSFSLTDYAQIKNGSYGKLIKSYYSESQKSEVKDKNTTVNTKKEPAKDTTGLSQMKKEADSLKASTDTLNNADLWKATDGKYDTAKINEAVKGFVKNYNDTLAQASKVTSKDVSDSTNYMMSMTNTMSKALSKIGVNVGADGKLSLNEETLKKANINNVKSLFSGQASYGAQIADKATEISKAAVKNASLYSSNGTASSLLSGVFNQWV